MMTKKFICIAIAWLSLLLAAFGYTGCSVFMAAKGPEKKDLSCLRPGNSRNLVLSELGKPIASERKDSGRLDIFRFTQGYSKGFKTGRVLFHGTADVMTLGLWEVIGTPAESVLDGKKMAFEVHYDTNDCVIKVIPLHEPGAPSSPATHTAASEATMPTPQSSFSALNDQRPAAKPQAGSIAESFHQNWAVIIGLSEYQYTRSNGLTRLIFADDDARAFAQVLFQLGWSDSHVKLLVNEGATKRNVTIALESWLTKAGPHDRLVLFWAGHAFADPEDPEKVYFACYDTDISIPATGYRMDRVRNALEEHQTKNVLLFADTCHAGKLITRGERAVGIVPRIDKMNRKKKIPKGWIFMVGADADRQAIEHTSWTNGAFTHCLVNGLKGAADGYQSVGRRDNIITMGELRAYLNSAMPEETFRVLGVAKRPVITTSTGDPDIWNLTLHIK